MNTSNNAMRVRAVGIGWNGVAAVPVSVGMTVRLVGGSDDLVVTALDEKGQRVGVRWWGDRHMGSWVALKDLEVWR